MLKQIVSLQVWSRQLMAICLMAAPAFDAAFSAEQKPLAPDPAQVQIARRFTRQFPEGHLKQSPIDLPEISAHAWTNYLSSLDMEHVYFLKSDIESFRASETNLGAKLKLGDVDFAYQVFGVFRERVTNRYAFVTALLEKGFDLQTQDTYKWKRKDMDPPASEEEWNDLWRKKIQNEFIQQTLSRELADAATTNKVEKPASEELPPSPVSSPAETIAKRYKQLMIVLNDSDSDWLLQKYLTAFAQAYDPHSAYMSMSSMDDFDIEMKLSLVGIGALLSSEDGAAKIVSLIKGGPADMDKRDKRLRPNDKIIAVASGDAPAVDILHWPLTKVVKIIRGEKGTKVVLTVIPASDTTGSTTKMVDLIRDEVRLEEQEASGRYEEVKDTAGATHNLGVITLPAFYANMKAGSVRDDDFKSAAYDVAKILEEMDQKQVEGIVIDLRNNGGGSLLEAIKLVGLFITSGPTVQVKDRSVKVLNDPNREIFFKGPLIVLVNRLSASASEIMAGALQDYGRALIVGDTKTHGKGTVQTILDLSRDKKMGSIKVTTGSYYRISGASTQLKGVTPDIVIHSPFDYMELGEEYLPNALDLSSVPPAFYSQYSDISQIVPALKERSEKRRADDARFAAYSKVLQRIETMRDTEELPLNIEERRKLARTEKELSEMEAELDPEAEDKPDKQRDTKHDLVLNETMKILADYIEIAKAKGIPVEMDAALAPAERSMAVAFAEWLMNQL